MFSDENLDKLVNFSTYTTTANFPSDPPWRQDMYNGLGNGCLVVPGANQNTEAGRILLTRMGYQQPRSDVAGPLFKYAPNPDIVHCPGDTRQLVGQRDHDGVFVHSRHQAAQPCRQRRCTLKQCGQGGSGTMDQKLAEIFIAPLADSDQTRSAAGR